MERPGVGVGALIIKDNKVLLGKRIGEHGGGTWAPPGGHLEMYETFEECAKREILEETGLIIKNIKFATITNDMFPETTKHYITVYLTAEIESGEVELKEPNKCEKWEWFEWNKLKANKESSSFGSISGKLFSFKGRN